MSAKNWIAAGVLLATAGCQLPRPTDGDTYTLQGDPWAAKAAEAKGGGAGGEASATAKDAGAKDASAPNAASPQAASAPTAAAKEARPPGFAFTILEQLEEARARGKQLDAENQQLKSDVAALTALVEQLKQTNQNLSELSDASVQSRAALDQEIDKVRQEQKALEARCRTLADDLLSERIQRVRVERELILAKVKQAEGKDDGP